MNHYKYIINPKTGRKVAVNGRLGRKILQKYLQTGGFIRSGSRILKNKKHQKGTGYSFIVEQAINGQPEVLGYPDWTPPIFKGELTKNNTCKK